MEASPTKGEGWSTFTCYDMTFNGEDLCQGQINKEEMCKEDGRPKKIEDRRDLELLQAHTHTHTHTERERDGEGKG